MASNKKKDTCLKLAKREFISREGCKHTSETGQATWLGLAQNFAKVVCQRVVGSCHWLGSARTSIECITCHGFGVVFYPLTGHLCNKKFSLTTASFCKDKLSLFVKGGPHSTMVSVLALVPSGPGFDSWHSWSIFWEMFTRRKKLSWRKKVSMLPRLIDSTVA